MVTCVLFGFIWRAVVFRLVWVIGSSFDDWCTYA
jgi:hypothetical protein